MPPDRRAGRNRGPARRPVSRLGAEPIDVEAQAQAHSLGAHSGPHLVWESRPQTFLARPLGAWPFANVLAMSRAQSMNSCASGLSIRFLRVMIPICRCVVGSSTGSTFSDTCLAENLMI